MAEIKINNTISHSDLIKLVNYDPITGIFTRRVQINRYAVGSIMGAKTGSGYLQIRLNNQRYYAHRLAWFYINAEWPKEYIDHIDGNKSNNAISNLRDVNRSENQQNLKKPNIKNKSGSSVPGVCYNNHWKKYVVNLSFGHKTKSFGGFSTLKEAEEECIKQRRIHYKYNEI